MFIEINKAFVDSVRKDINDNRNIEVGYVYKQDNTFIKLLGKSLIVQFPKGRIMGIEMHTHPLHITKGDNIPPSFKDLMTSYKHYKLNDAVVFDKSGIWVYKANSDLLNLDDNVLTNEMINKIKYKVNYSIFDISDKIISIETHINRMKKLLTIQYGETIFNIGFDMKYYTYANFNKIGSLKLKYIDTNNLLLKIDTKCEVIKSDIKKFTNNTILYILTPERKIHRVIIDEPIPVIKNIGIIIIKHKNNSKPLPQDYIDILKSRPKNDTLVVDKNGIFVIRTNNKLLEFIKSNKLTKKFKENLLEKIKLVDNTDNKSYIQKMKILLNVNNNNLGFNIKYHKFSDIIKLDYITARYIYK
jgi:hypothetical protein